MLNLYYASILYYVSYKDKKFKLNNTSGWSSLIISYMSRRTNSFSGDLLLLATASPKLRSIATLLPVTSAKHWVFTESCPSNIWSQIFFSPTINNLICSNKLSDLWDRKRIDKKKKEIHIHPYSNSHVMNPVSNLSLQNLPLHFLNIILTQPLYT